MDRDWQDIDFSRNREMMRRPLRFFVGLTMGIFLGFWIGATVARKLNGGPNQSGNPHGSTQVVANGPFSRYTDQDVAAIQNKWSAHDPLDDSRLSVIPAGETVPLELVLKQLGLDVCRLGAPTIGQVNLNILLSWQLSDSYDLIATASLILDPENTQPVPNHLRRQILNVQLIRVLR